jgi:hypothetical protein
MFSIFRLKAVFNKLKRSDNDENNKLIKYLKSSTNVPSRTQITGIHIKLNDSKHVPQNTLLLK